MSATTNRISRLQLVLIPSSDQDRSLAFYEALGFSARNDIPWADGHRWVEVYPPDGDAGLALVPAEREDLTGMQTGIILNTDDIDAAHAEMRAGGVDVDATVARIGAPGAIRIGTVELVGPVPPMFWFRDPDGNALLLVENA
jgi:catechol 2,3-dioxygenase-like lactoylglutathione lyase family enzyme